MARLLSPDVDVERTVLDRLEPAPREADRLLVERPRLPLQERSRLREAWLRPAVAPERVDAVDRVDLDDEPERGQDDRAWLERVDVEATGDALPWEKLDERPDDLLEEGR